MKHPAPAGSEVEPANEDLSASNRVLTLPNLISAARMALVPWFAWVFWTRSNDVLAFVLIVVIGSTDWVDGYVARRMGQVSRLGKLLDPVADRAAIIVVLLALMLKGVVPAAPAAAILARDLIVSAVFPVLEAKRFPRIPVNRVGKLATAFIFGGMGFAVFSLPAADGLEAFAVWAAGGLLTLGAVLYWAAGGLYVREVWRLMRHGVRAG
ncbi:MAG: CDP-alcohol phosphatidyltransferase family protein [Actinomycetota bacterium]|nr:CDP-alcohol phosphatidyltransferase family protein [Actinomycetota bacterium]